MTLANHDIALPFELKQLSDVLGSGLERLATPNPGIQSAALTATKHIFDLSVRSEPSSRSHIIDLISGLAPSQAPQTRSKAKVVDSNNSVIDKLKDELFTPTPINELYVDGMDDEQVWAQLDLRTQNMCRMLDFVLEGEVDEPNSKSHESDDSMDGEEEGDGEDDDERLRLALEALKADAGDLSLNELYEKYGFDNEDFDEDEGDDDEEGQSDSLEEDAMEEIGEEDISPLRDPSSDEESDEEMYQPPRKRKKGTSELDDDFFDLAEFNAYTERAEAKSASRGKLSRDDEEEEEEPLDLFSNVDAMMDTGDDDTGGNDIFYNDFFEPPRGVSSKLQKPSPRKQKQKQTRQTQVRFNEEVRVKKIKPTGKNRSLHDDDDDEEDDDNDFVLQDDDFSRLDDDIDDAELPGLSSQSDSGSGVVSEDDFAEGTTIQRLKQDLFDDEEDEERSDMTTHEHRMAAIREQIQELEAENVAQKDWMLMGEAGSRQRPENSLLEEDLDFERVRKAVPIITEEEVKTLEETIKARLLEGRFDDVVRVRAFEDKPFLPSKLLELQDTKSKASLAQIYENDYMVSQTGAKLPDDRDGKLQKEHDTINSLWEKICGKLDALSNAHFVPKQPKATISTITNAPTVSIESALPTTKTATSMLAPEEIFASSPSALKVRSEMTPMEKRAARTKERRMKKKQRDSLEKTVDKFAKNQGSVKQQKKAALDSLVKQGKGITVVGKESAAKQKRRRKA